MSHSKASLHKRADALQGSKFSEVTPRKLSFEAVLQGKLQIMDSEIKDKVPYLTINKKMANKGFSKIP